MNKKVLKTMIWLVIGELIAWYILKIFFPEQFVMVIQNENLIKVGNYIDNHQWATIICSSVTSFIIYWLYLCAILHKLKLSIKELFIVLITIAIIQVLYEFDVAMANGLSLISMVVLPYICKAEFNSMVLVFTVHSISQLLSISIRNLPELLINVNSITSILMTLECYFWLFLFYLYFNYKEKEV